MPGKPQTSTAPAFKPHFLAFSFSLSDKGPSSQTKENEEFHSMNFTMIKKLSKLYRKFEESQMALFAFLFVELMVLMYYWAKRTLSPLSADLQQIQYYT